MGFKGDRVDWATYFSLYNIEYEIFLNILEKLYLEGEPCPLTEAVKPVVFDKLNPKLVYKLIERGLLRKIKRDKEYFTITTRGLAAFFQVIKHFHDTLINSYHATAKEIADKVAEKIFLGGIYRVRPVHEKLTERTLELLAAIGLITKHNDGSYGAVDVEKRVESLSVFLEKISGLSTIRTINNLVDLACNSLNIPLDYENIVLTNLTFQSIILEKKDPQRILLDLLYKVKNIAYDKAKQGKLVEAAAFEALGLSIIGIMEKMGYSIHKHLREHKTNYLFHLYSTLGDYFYNNLLFDLAKTMYHWAVEITHDNPSLLKEAKKVNAKYLLSLSRSLAEKGKYEEALARLQELVGYYRSTGSIRESLIARALMKEYVAELEIRSHKPCNAYKSFISAASLYEDLGGEYKSKGTALLVKAFISEAECYVKVYKDIDKAINILEKASQLSEQILSPHLKNVVESMLSELRGSRKVIKEDYLGAYKEYLRSAKYYGLRGKTLRALLNTARSYKFKAYHEITRDNLVEAHNYLVEARKTYYQLLRRIIKKYNEKGRLDYYLLKESIKGFFDVDAFARMIELMNNPENIGNTELLETIISDLVEAGRTYEYRLLTRRLNSDKELPAENPNNIVETDLSPRTKIFLKLLSKIKSV